MPPKPNMAAMMAMIKKITDQRNITDIVKFKTRENCRLPDLPEAQNAAPYNSVQIFVPMSAAIAATLTVEACLRNAAAGPAIFLRRWDSLPC